MDDLSWTLLLKCPKLCGYPNSWMVFVMDNPKIKRDDLGLPLWKPPYDQIPDRIRHLEDSFVTKKCLNNWISRDRFLGSFRFHGIGGGVPPSVPRSLGNCCSKLARHFLQSGIIGGLYPTNSTMGLRWQILTEIDKSIYLVHNHGVCIWALLYSMQIYTLSDRIL